MGLSFQRKPFPAILDFIRKTFSDGRVITLSVWKGGRQKLTSDDEEEGGVTIPPKIDDVNYEQPLMSKNVWAIIQMYKYDLKSTS